MTTTGYGDMTPDQIAYLLAWFDGVVGAHFGAGVYCSGMPANASAEDPGIAAEDIRSKAATRHISYFVYNDACPPALGCVYGKTAPAPSASKICGCLAIRAIAAATPIHEELQRHI